LIRRGLRDKRANVRRKAADWAGCLHIRDVVTDLETAFAVEKNNKAKETIEFELRLLRDGYILKPSGDGVFWVTALTRWMLEQGVQRIGN